MGKWVQVGGAETLISGQAKPLKHRGEGLNRCSGNTIFLEEDNTPRGVHDHVNST